MPADFQLNEVMKRLHPLYFVAICQDQFEDYESPWLHPQWSTISLHHVGKRYVEFSTKLGY